MKLSHENQLIVLCSAVNPSKNTIQKIHQLAHKNLDWNHIYSNCKKEKILPLFYSNLLTLKLTDKIPPNINQKFQNLTYAITGKNIILNKELSSLLKLFKQHGVEAIILKGLAYHESLYGDLSKRAMGDIDLLIRENQLRKVSDLLLNSGYVQHSGWLEHPRIDTHHLVPFFNRENKSAIEVHWNISMYEKIFPVNMEEIWNRAKYQCFGSETGLILSPEDMILHQCCHLFITHQDDFTLKNLCDLAEMGKQFTPQLDWELLTESSIRYKLAPLVYCGLTLVSGIFEVKIPQQPLAQLKESCSENQLNWLNTFFNSDFIQNNENKIRTPLSRLFWIQGTKNKLKYFITSLFPPLELIKKRYALSKNSKRAYLYYFSRPFQATIKHGWTIFKLIRIKFLKPLSST